MEKKSISTRDRIISSAFSFYTKPVLVNVSLSMIASKSGITKAAIYKHFKNKEDLNNAMEEKLFDSLMAILSRIEIQNDGNSSSVFESIVILLMTQKEYLYYWLSSKFNSSIDEFILRLKERGFTFFDDVFDSDGNILNMELYKNIIYKASCIIFFQLVHDRINRDLNVEIGYAEVVNYAHRLCMFVNSGLGGDISGSGIFKLATIDSKCAASIEKNEETDRIFTAFAEIIEEKGFKGVTVESLAKRAGYAKSSIYSRFDNKSHMVINLLVNELERMFIKIKENMVYASNSPEKVYVVMETVFLYFLHNDKVYNVCKMLQFQSDGCQDFTDHSPFINSFGEFLNETKLIEKLPDLGFKINAFDIYYSWIIMMPSFLLMHSKLHEFDMNIVQAALKDIFYMMETGIKC